MLVSLHVKNLALIQESEVMWEPGFNVLTGETGAGKSILIGSVNLALGAKADKDFIRKGEEYALVELLFQTKDAKVEQRMKEMELPLEEDGSIIISRKIQGSRSVSRVNGETVTVKQVRELAEQLIDIHGQHEHQSLLHKKNHQKILDDFAGEELLVLKEELKEVYHAYQAICRELEENEGDDASRKKQLDLAYFEHNEIENARLVGGEDEELEAAYERMVHSKKIGEAISTAYSITGYDSQEGAGAGIGRALREIKTVRQYDSNLEQMISMLEDIDNLLNDYNRSVSDYIATLEFDDADFIETENRLNTINHLKEKYGDSIEKILEYQNQNKELIEKLEHFKEYRLELEEKKKKKAKDLDSLCQRVSTIRKKNAKLLGEAICEALKDLNFLSVEFEIVVMEKNQVGADGIDDVEFMISTNPGESIKPLQQVASGGELSRIMLAIKTVLAKKDTIDTLIFDEIDTGISGVTAWKVAAQLGKLGKTHQVICITHLAQIAAMGDIHFQIEKTSDQNSTSTSITKISGDETKKELARLLGGDIDSKAARLNAEELIEKANQLKTGTK